MCFSSMLEGVFCLTTPPERMLRSTWLGISEGQGFFYQYACDRSVIDEGAGAYMEKLKDSGVREASEYHDIWGSVLFGDDIPESYGRE